MPAPAALAPFAAFGVEIELMIVDAATLNARPLADAILRDPADGTDGFKCLAIPQLRARLRL